VTEVGVKVALSPPSLLDDLNEVLKEIEWGEPFKSLLSPEMHFMERGFVVSVQSFDTNTGEARRQHWLASFPFNPLSLMNKEWMLAYARFHLLRLIEHECDESVRVGGVKVIHPHERTGWNKTPEIL